MKSTIDVEDVISLEESVLIMITEDHHQEDMIEEEVTEGGKIVALKETIMGIKIEIDVIKALEGVQAHHPNDQNLTGKIVNGIEVGKNQMP